MRLEFEYGHGIMEAQLPDNTDVFIPGETVTVRGDIFTAPRGKVLAGWSLEENGKVDYKAGDTFRMPGGSYDLYAVWKDAETMTHTAYIYQRLS